MQIQFNSTSPRWSSQHFIQKGSVLPSSHLRGLTLPSKDATVVIDHLELSLQVSVWNAYLGQFIDYPKNHCQDFDATAPFGTKTHSNLITIIDGKKKKKKESHSSAFLLVSVSFALWLALANEMLAEMMHRLEMDLPTEVSFSVCLCHHHETTLQLAWWRMRDKSELSPPGIPDEAIID